MISKKEWSNGVRSWFKKRKLHEISQVFDPNSSYALHSKALRMIDDIQNNTPLKTRVIVNEWINLCCKRLGEMDQYHLVEDIQEKLYNKKMVLYDVELH